MVTYLLALGEILVKFCKCADKLTFMRTLTASELFVLKLTLTVIWMIIQTKIAL